MGCAALEEAMQGSGWVTNHAGLQETWCCRAQQHGLVVGFSTRLRLAWMIQEVFSNLHGSMKAGVMY